MNKRGFTLIELLSVVIIIGLIAVIVATTVNNAGTNAKYKILKGKIKNLEKSAVVYGQDNRSALASETLYVSVNTLIQNKYISPDKDDKKNPNSIKNPVTGGVLDNCSLKVYLKYNRIYAEWQNTDEGDCHVE